MARGIDISYAQPITPSLDGLDFVVVKASEGNFRDPQWEQHSSKVRAAGKVLGAYHFGRREWSAVMQAELLWSVAQGADFWALDYEPSTRGTLMTRTQAREFVIAFRDVSGKSVGLYQSLGHPQPYPADSLGADWRWVAYWGQQPPPVRWQFWQWKGTPLDRDYYNGSVNDLRAFLRLDTVPPANAAVEGEAMSNLVPLTCHRVVDVPAGTRLYEYPGGPVYTTLPDDVTLGMLGATQGQQSGYYHVADGDYGVYVDRAAVVVRTADKNVGA